MAKINLNNVSGGYNLTTINSNFKKLQDTLNDQVLYRDNPINEPNQMESDLDMNDKRVYNLPTPVLDHEPARYKEFKEVKPAIEQVHVDAERAELAAESAEVSAIQSSISAQQSEFSREVAEEAVIQVQDGVVESEAILVDVRAIAGALGPEKFYDTYSDALADAAGPRKLVEVSNDETRKGMRTRYWSEGGSLTFVTNLDQMRDVVNIAEYNSFVGDGVADDKPAVLSAASAAILSGKTLYCPAGFSVKLSGDVSFKGIRNVEFNSDIVIDSGTLTVGGNINGGKFTISLKAVTNGTSPIVTTPPVTPVVRVVGVSNSEITIGSCNYVQLYANASIPGDRFTAYNHIRLTGPVSLLELTDSGTALSYVNENFIYASRVFRYRVTGVGYAHNHNKLFHPTMEGASVEISFNGVGVSSNQVYGARFESVSLAPGITFGAGTYSNTVFSTWSGVGNPRGQFVIPIAVVDLGSGNMVTTDSAFQFRKTPLFNVGAASQILSTATDTTSPDPRISPANAGVANLVTKAVITPSLKGFSVNSGRWVALTEPIPVKLGDVVGFNADYDGSLVRTSIFVLDADMEPLLDNSGGEFISQASSSFVPAFGQYTQGTNQTAANINIQTASVIRSEVKYIRVGFSLGVAGFIRAFNSFIYTQSLGRTPTEATGCITTLRSLSGTPTQGYAPLGTVIYDHTGNALRRCIFQYENRISGSLSSGATSVTVTAISTVTNGDICGILLDNGETHWSVVSSLSGSTFTITGIPAARTVSDGGRIVFNRWV